MGILSHIKNGLMEVWDDIYDARLDDKAAPDLGDLLRGEEEPMYTNPKEFFARTYLTKSMENLMEDIAETLKNERSGAIYLLTSLFGGGKTHTQIALYHAFSNPDALREISPQLAAKIAEVGKPTIIVMDGSRADLVPHPKEPYKAEGFTIKTIWGMLAYKLGAYSKVKQIDSEKDPAPEVTLLKSILSETREPILILMDEIVHYVFNMDKSQDLRDYAKKVLLFLDYLSRAIEDTPRTVLVISIQAEYRKVEGQKKLLEEEIFAGYASKVLRNLSRESTKIITPVSPDDVAKVLQRRIFKKIPEEQACKARDELYKKYYEYKELFGVESDWQYCTETGKVATPKDTYPFHPKYIEVLQEFVTRNRDLQKTRDAIRITRKVVRRLLRLRRETTFIMPWHIDLKDGDIRTRILTESRREFRDVVSRDIVTEEGRLGSVVECSKSELAYKIATAIFLKTYTYETFKEPLKIFPDMKEVALMVYDPETFTIEGFSPLDIKDILAEMVSRLPHFTSENGRYWFTPYPSVIEYVEKKAAEKLREPRLELHRTITECVKKILTREERRGIEEKGEIFDKEDTKVIGYGELLEEVTIDDKPKPQLVVLVKPEIIEDEVRDLILMRGKEGRRTYRNTIVVLCPHQQANFNTLLTFAAKIKSAEEVMESLTEYYTDKDIRSLQERKLKDYIQDNLRLLNEHLLSALTRIAYPVREAGRDEIKWTITSAASAIIPQVEAGLKNPATGPKLRLDISFKDLAEFLKINQNWDLIEGTNRYAFRNILETFYAVTSAPLTTRHAIEYAIKKGVENFDIGILMDGKLYWKQIGPQNGSETPSKIKDEAEILPYRIAAIDLKDRLLAESGLKKIGRETYKIRYEVEIQNKRISLEDLINLKDWEKILKVGLIIKEEQKIETGFMLNLKPSSLIIKTGEEVKVTASITPIDSYDFPISIQAEKGKVTPDKGKAPFEITWDLGVIEKVGEHKFRIKAIGEDGKEFTSILTVIVESLEEEINVERLDLTHVGAKLIQIIPNNLTALQMAVDTLSKLNQEAVVSQLILKFGENITFMCKEVDSKLVGYFAQKFRDIERALNLEETQFEGALKLKQPIILDSSKITAFNSLSGRALFKLWMMKK
ncbi:MAG: ATP-binding protein [Candidatus Methanomethyliaceae archaeon]|nr:ATP-binding protein [Candidatus Methanomethyliaceae archaeon]